MSTIPKKAEWTKQRPPLSWATACPCVAPPRAQGMISGDKWRATWLQHKTKGGSDGDQEYMGKVSCL